VCVFNLGRKLTSISKTQNGWMACIKLKFATTLISEAVHGVDRLLLHASAFDEPDTPGVEWLEGERSLPLPRSLANIAREISEKKWAEAREWAGGRTSTKKYKMPKSQRPDGTVAGSTKRLASRFYQLKTGHCRTGQYLHWTKSRSTAQCWWCKCPSQTRDHLLKSCPRWKSEQKTLWEEVWKEAGRGRWRWKAHELFAEQSCSQAVLDFLSVTEVGKTVPAEEREEDVESEASEWELRERAEREEEKREEELGAEDVGAGGEHCLFLPTPSFMASAEKEWGGGGGATCFSLSFPM